MEYLGYLVITLLIGVPFIFGKHKKMTNERSQPRATPFRNGIDDKAYSQLS